MFRSPRFFIVLIINSLFFFTVSPNFQSKQLNLSVGKDMVADGQFIGSESIMIGVGQTLKGNGVFNSPTITLKVTKFEFTGTIHCDGICTITTKEPFDETMFTRSGTGQFIITVDPALDLANNTSKYPLTPAVEIPKPQSSEVPNFQPLVSKKFTVKGSTFTIEGSWYISVAEAIENNQIQVIQELLEQNPSIKNNCYGLAQFMLFAGLLGNLELAEEFIRLGADVNGQDSKYGIGQCHLITAVVAKEAQFVDLLLKVGANPNVENRDWFPALIIAVVNNDVETVRCLVQSKTINLDAGDRNRRTALMHAASKGNAEIVELLLKAGARVDIQDWYQATAIDFAIDQKHTDIQHLIQEHGNFKKSQKQVSSYSTENVDISIASPKIAEHNATTHFKKLQTNNLNIKNQDSLLSLIQQNPGLAIVFAVIGVTLLNDALRIVRKAYL